MNERIKMHLHRMIWLGLCLLLISLPFIVNAMKPELELVDEEVIIENYYSSLNESNVSVQLKFNRDVDSGYVTISFYDEAEHMLETKKMYLLSNGSTAYDSYEIVKGKVDKYEIVTYDFKPEKFVPDSLWLLVVVFITIPMLISSLFLNYQEYEFDDKTIISVYAGWIHHTLRINGKKYDEHTTLHSFVPIKLSTTVNCVKIEATISRFCNRIALKINDKLI